MEQGLGVGIALWSRPSLLHLISLIFPSSARFLKSNLHSTTAAMADFKPRLSVADTDLHHPRQNSTAIELGQPESFKAHLRGRQFSTTGENEAIVNKDVHKLKRDLSGRHMQMIAIGQYALGHSRQKEQPTNCHAGGAIGAGVFVGTGNALATGGPASLLLGFIIIGVMMLMMMQALGELAVMYPVNGAFYSYMVRFIDPSW